MPSALSLLVRTDSGVEIAIATNRVRSSHEFLLHFFPNFVQMPPRAIALPEIAYLAHHLVSLFEGPDVTLTDHFVVLN